MSSLYTYYTYHDAIIALHSNVVTVFDSDNGVTALDASGNKVYWNDSDVNVKSKEIYDDWRLRDLRLERDKLIAETDWWTLSDTPAMTQAQTDYRQALRDITNTYSNLDDVVWPTKP